MNKLTRDALEFLKLNNCSGICQEYNVKLRRAGERVFATSSLDECLVNPALSDDEFDLAVTLQERCIVVLEAHDAAVYMDELTHLLDNY